MRNVPRTAVIGAGVTGLAIGSQCGLPVFEQSDGPGGICRSYYLQPGSTDRLDHEPATEGAYRFEVGGGHWIFGGDEATIARLQQVVDFRVYQRRAVVRLGSLELTVPYPLQGHLEALNPELVAAVRHETALLSEDPGRAVTLRQWLRACFGPTLCELFFFPFHDRYTAALTDTVAPQDAYKSPSATSPSGSERGYNVTFRYPVGGLDRLASRLAGLCDVRYGKQVVAIDGADRVLYFADGSEFGYDQVMSSLPLDRAAAFAGLDTGPSDPHTSVLVLNIGARRGARCPDAHWQYEADSVAGFHRVGFYSNVEAGFLPAGSRTGSHVSMYVERAFAAGRSLPPADLDRYISAVVEELQAREYLADVEVLDASWVETAYTWHTPGSSWRERTIADLAAIGVQQVGRYGRWHFQGIADSIREGLQAGQALGR
jgi:protoporphyrinogen oxidase